MDSRATTASANLLDGILATFHSPPSTTDIQALSLACPPAMVLAAMEMIDNGEGASLPSRLPTRLTQECPVGRISLPNGRVLYQVSGGSGAYTVHVDIPSGYCPCPAFSQLVLHSQDQIIVSEVPQVRSYYTRGLIQGMRQCKHLLAVRLADVLDKFVDKSLGLNWVAGLSTRFATVMAT